jgi:GDP-L-fucose synthase
LLAHIHEADAYLPYLQWNRNASDGQFRKPASNVKLARLLKEDGVDFQFTPFEQGMLLI